MHKFEFESRDEPVYSSDFYYDLFLGGYISPRALLVDKDLAYEVGKAVQLVQAFLDAAEDAGVLEGI